MEIESPPLAQRLAFLRLDPADVKLLAELRPAVEARSQEFVDVFYRHLLGFDEVRELLRDEQVRARLLEAQARYFVSLVCDEIDEAYVDARYRIGLTHERIGLGPAWYVGAYAIYCEEFDRVLSEHFRSSPHKRQAARSALHKRLLLDMQLAVESYMRKSQEQLDSLNRELAAVGRNLASEVDAQRVELERTTDRARAAEQLASVGTLAAGLAHEIGTPMGVIRGHAELLEDKVDDDKSRSRLRTIIAQIDRISNIMQALLDLARPRAPLREPVDLCEVLDTAASFLEEKLRRRRIEVERHFEGPAVVDGDAEKLQQLFLNLMLNAIDAMPDGGHLSLELERCGDGFVEAVVADDGSGISPADLGRIFDPFVTTKEAGRGSGLGLVVAHGVAVDHGGDIEVESEIGHGTRFSVRLPLRGRPEAG